MMAREVKPDPDALAKKKRGRGRRGKNTDGKEDGEVSESRLNPQTINRTSKVKTEDASVASPTQAQQQSQLELPPSYEPHRTTNKPSLLGLLPLLQLKTYRVCSVQLKSRTISADTTNMITRRPFKLS